MGVPPFLDRKIVCTRRSTIARPPPGSKNVVFARLGISEVQKQHFWPAPRTAFGCYTVCSRFRHFLEGGPLYDRGVDLGHPLFYKSPPIQKFSNGRRAGPSGFLVESGKNPEGVPGPSPAIVGVLDGGIWKIVFFQGYPHFGALLVSFREISRKTVIFPVPAEEW